MNDLQAPGESAIGLPSPRCGRLAGSEAAEGSRSEKSEAIWAEGSRALVCRVGLVDGVVAGDEMARLDLLQRR
jgi:hypothetical protein